MLMNRKQNKFKDNIHIWEIKYTFYSFLTFIIHRMRFIESKTISTNIKKILQSRTGRKLYIEGTAYFNLGMLFETNMISSFGDSIPQFNPLNSQLRFFERTSPSPSRARFTLFGSRLGQRTNCSWGNERLLRYGT